MMTVEQGLVVVEGNATSSHVGGATTFAEGLVVTGNARVMGNINSWYRFNYH